MHNLSDQELDLLSREAAENYEAVAAPGLWDELKKRLDTEMPENKNDKRRHFWLFGFAGIAILVSLGVGITVMRKNVTAPYSINRTESTSGKLKTGEQKATNTASFDKKTTYTQPDLVSRTNDPVDLLATQSSTIHKTTQFQKEKTKKSISQKSDPSVHIANKVQRITASSKIQQQDQLHKHETEKKHIFSNPEGQTLNNQVTENEKQKASDPLMNLGETKKLSVSAATDTDNDQKKMVESPAVSSQTSVEKNNKSYHKKSWEFAAVFGPDFSNVGFAAPDKTGMNVGILVNYRFTNRLSVQTGLLYSEKHYTTLGNDYTGYPGYNMSNPNLKMQKVQANCFMWDLPVNLRYDWLLRKKSIAFVSTGISSYFMNKEDLHYYYTYNNYNRYKAWVNEKNSSYWMAAINISVGYEQRITPQFSLQAEPFFKIPVSQIGYGNIYLNSLGMFISAKYSPQSKTFKNSTNR